LALPLIAIRSVRYVHMSANSFRQAAR